MNPYDRSDRPKTAVNEPYDRSDESKTIVNVPYDRSDESKTIVNVSYDRSDDIKTAVNMSYDRSDETKTAVNEPYDRSDESKTIVKMSYDRSDGTKTIVNVSYDRSDEKKIAVNEPYDRSDTSKIAVNEPYDRSDGTKTIVEATITHKNNTIMTQQINNISLTHLTLGLHLDFHYRVNKLINSIGADALHIAPQATQYASLLEQEEIILNRKTAYVSSFKLRDVNRKCDNGVGVLMQVINAYRTALIPEKRKAAQALAPITPPPKGRGDHGYRPQTREVRCMLDALATEPARTHLATLSLTDDVEMLRQANALFDAALNGKLQEEVERTAQNALDTHELRSSLDQAYAAIVQVVNAYAVVQSTPQIEDFIIQVNATISLTKHAER